MNSAKERTFRYTEKITGVGLVGMLVLGCFVVLRPFISVIMWAAILCYATWPACEWLVRHLRGRRTLAASIMTIALVLLIVVPLVLLGLSLKSSVEHLLTVVQRINREGLPTAPAWLSSLPLAGHYLDQLWGGLAHNTESTTEIVKILLTKSRGWLLHHGKYIGLGMLQLLMSAIVAFFFYRDGHIVARRVVETSQRIMGEYTQHIFTLVSATVRAVVYGIVATALAQGVMAAVGFSLVGLPACVFWALMVVALSFLPFGAPLVWGGVTIWLLMHGSVGWAVFMALWGLIVISGIDNVVRPIVISRYTRLTFLPVLLGVLGGLRAFGLLGVFLGPTLLAVGMSVAREFAAGPSHKKKQSAAIPPADPASDEQPPPAPDVMLQ